jgi:hypothetical protein
MLDLWLVVRSFGDDRGGGVGGFIAIGGSERSWMGH